MDHEISMKPLSVPALPVALKEWAVICAALARGRQSLLLRKGGIAEPTGLFKLEHPQFWLYPTFAHQHRTGIQAEALPWLEQAESGRPAPGLLRLELHAQVQQVFHVQNLERVLELAPLHVWSEETVRMRFAYREPGLFVVLVRVYRVDTPLELADDPGYEGCRSWVELSADLPSTIARPVVDDATFQHLMEQLGVGR